MLLEKIVDEIAGTACPVSSGGPNIAMRPKSFTCSCLTLVLSAGSINDARFFSGEPRAPFQQAQRNGARFPEKTHIPNVPFAICQRGRAPNLGNGVRARSTFRACETIQENRAAANISRINSSAARAVCL